MFVIDASVACAAVLPDEDGQAARAILGRGIESGMVAPAIWLVEIANTLTVAARRGRLTHGDRDILLSHLVRLPVRLAAHDAEALMTDILPLADRNTLSLYDASYLAVAVTAGIGLATLDRRLAAACVAEGIEVIAP